jgi:hypothetical protein
LGTARYLAIKEVRHGCDGVEAKSQNAVDALHKEHKEGNREGKAACRNEIGDGENLE